MEENERTDQVKNRWKDRRFHWSLIFPDPLYKDGDKDVLTVVDTATDVVSVVLRRDYPDRFIHMVEAVLDDDPAWREAGTTSDTQP